MLKLEHISKTFNPGTVNEKKALSGLSLHLEPGDFVTIVGSNGAGKSTLFNAIAGAFYVDEGAIRLAGEDITFKPEYKRSREIGRLFQDPMRGTAPHMTIEENLALAYLRTAKNQNAFFSRTSKAEKQFFRDRLALLDATDVLVDGPFVQALHSFELAWRGSSNQRLIDVPATRATGRVVLWDTHEDFPEKPASW